MSNNARVEVWIYLAAIRASWLFDWSQESRSSEASDGPKQKSAQAIAADGIEGLIWFIFLVLVFIDFITPVCAHQ
jgi:hypothetical protein